jgi:hypothetical protein
MKAGGTILTNMVLPTYHAGCFSKNEIPALQRIGGNAANRKPNSVRTVLRLRRMPEPGFAAVSKLSVSYYDCRALLRSARCTLGRVVVDPCMRLFMHPGKVDPGK